MEMNTDDIRESDDEQEDQDYQDDRDEEDDAIKRTNKSENPRNDATETSSNAVENREENRPRASTRSQISQSRNVSKTKSPQSRSQPQHQPQAHQPSWRSANAFVNFMQDFRKDNLNALSGRNMFQMCGERWKAMTVEEKQPYIDAANTVKRLKHRNTDAVKQQQPLEQSKKSAGRVLKRKVESKRREATQKRTKAIVRDAKISSDTDTATTTVHSSMSDTDSS